MFKRNTKESQGAVDNASGVSILIELAKYYKLHPLENYDVLFLWCGAEEWGMRGSKYFCKKYMPYLRKEYSLNHSVNINIDMVGSHIGLLNKPRLAVLNRNKKLLEQINFSADLLNIPLSNHSKLIRPKSDHLSFKKNTRRLRQRGFQIACINSIKDTKLIHTIKDTPEECSIENLFGCFKICLFTSRLLDSEVSG